MQQGSTVPMDIDKKAGLCFSPFSIKNIRYHKTVGAMKNVHLKKIH